MKILEVALKLHDKLTPHLKRAGKQGVASLKRLQTQLKKTRGGFSKLTKSIAAFVAIVASMAIIEKAIGWLKSVTELSIDVAESQSMVATTYGDMTDRLHKWSKTTIAGITLAKHELEDFAAVNFNVMTAMGLAREEAFKLSTQMVDLASDLASFKNIKPEDAVNRFRSALTGEFESLKSLGIVILEKTIKDKALRMGYKLTAGQLKQNDKAMVISTLLVEKSGVAVEDLKRTQDSFANVLKSINVAWTNFRLIIGNVIGSSPGVVEVLKTIRTWIVKMNDALGQANIDGNDLAGKTFAALVTGGLKVIAAFNKVAEFATMVAIGVNKVGKAVNMLNFVQAITDAKVTNNVTRILNKNIAALDDTLLKMAKTDILLTNIIDDVNDALERSKKLTVDGESVWDAFGKTQDNVTDSMNKGTAAIKNQSYAFSNLIRKLSSFMELWNKYIASRGRSVEDMFYKHGLGAQPQAEKAIKTFGTDRSHPSYKMGETIARLRNWRSMYQPSGVGTGGQTVGQIGEDYLKSGAGIAAMIGSSFSGFQSGGGSGAISALLPTIGSAFGPIGSVIGSLLGGLFGRKSNRGQTETNPVFTKDVQIKSLITELTNVTKSLINISAGAKFDMIGSDLRTQIIRIGV